MNRPHWLVEALAVGNDSGLGRHVRLIVDALASIPQIRFSVLLSGGAGGDYQPPSSLKVWRVRPKPLRLWNACALPLWESALRPDGVLHLGYSLPPWKSSRKRVLLIPDAGPLETGLLRMSRYNDKNRHILESQIPRAHHALVSTRFTAERLRALLGTDSGRLSVLPPFGAYTAAWTQATSEDADIARRFPQGYFLSVGNIEPRKNHVGLLQAYAWLRRRQADAPPLVLIGHEAWDGGATREEALRLGLQAHVAFTGHVPDASLGAYLRQATAFVTASLYEGFGMPLFEAMCLGRACIYHRGTSHEDFAAGAALSVDCRSPQELGEALESLWRDLPLRRNLEEKAKSSAASSLRFDMAAGLQQALEKA